MNCRTFVPFKSKLAKHLISLILKTSKIFRQTDTQLAASLSQNINNHLTLPVVLYYMPVLCTFDVLESHIKKYQEAHNSSFSRSCCSL